MSNIRHPHSYVVYANDEWCENNHRCWSKIAALLLSLLTILLPRSVLAWGAAGHQVIAAEAWRQLSPSLKAQAIEVLKAHPDFQKWQSAYHTNASFDAFAYVFMHQPLHCASLSTADYPTGDKGGNDFYVRPAQRGIRLHGIWDGLLGTSANPQTQWNYAIEIDQKYSRPSLQELDSHKTPKEWSLESRELAIDKAYLRGELKGSMTAGNAFSLPTDYTKQAKEVAEKQAALAGYRLADEITKYLKVAGPVPLLPLNTNVAASPTTSTQGKKISAAEATNYYNQTVVVTGKVAQVSVRPTMAFINLDKAFPNSPFAAVIFEADLDKFGDLNKLSNQDVEISGTIKEYRGKPEIALQSTNQLKVVVGAGK